MRAQAKMGLRLRRECLAGLYDGCVCITRICLKSPTCLGTRTLPAPQKPSLHHGLMVPTSWLQTYHYAGFQDNHSLAFLYRFAIYESAATWHTASLLVFELHTNVIPLQHSLATRLCEWLLYTDVHAELYWMLYSVTIPWTYLCSLVKGHLLCLPE